MGYGASKGADPVMNSKINTPNIHLGDPLRVLQVEKYLWSSSDFEHKSTSKTNKNEHTTNKNTGISGVIQR